MSVVELRRTKRTPVDIPLEFTQTGVAERTPGRATDLSVGGMYVQTHSPSAFGTQLTVFVAFPGEKRVLQLPAVVRWTRQGHGMGLQLGLLGARETHAIMSTTQAVRAAVVTS